MNIIRSLLPCVLPHDKSQARPVREWDMFRPHERKGGERFHLDFIFKFSIVRTGMASHWSSYLQLEPHATDALTAMNNRSTSSTENCHGT